MGAVYLTPKAIIKADIQAKLGLEEGDILFDDEMTIQPRTPPWKRPLRGNMCLPFPWADDPGIFTEL